MLLPSMRTQRPAPALGAGPEWRAAYSGVGDLVLRLVTGGREECLSVKNTQTFHRANFEKPLKSWYMIQC